MEISILDIRPHDDFDGAVISYCMRLIFNRFSVYEHPDGVAVFYDRKDDRDIYVKAASDGQAEFPNTALLRFLEGICGLE